MSIVTKNGDGGQTCLMYGMRVPKHHPRIEACGAVDELNAALGLARAQTPPRWLAEALRQVQQDLIVLMGELATDPSCHERLRRDGFPTLGPGHLERLEAEVRRLEAELAPPRGWALPGANPLAAALDFARTVCRRAERRVCALTGPDSEPHRQAVMYLNRLSDLLWLWARRMEQPDEARGKGPS
ncbi:cob(I)yrinic acid a,c-diamide adenosyltransferase [Limisphaera sp. VF-2]|uniref:cob(I)yrinic acid a,c-diamide adenosyltransferase n=1 Tax=Limisphaera sp. VF-2 TaxID=3400418 RepID=UPI00175751FF|nr:cob(I)yrinic acid a,c-diamide adenosyltransferase [Limisphaera sp.]